MTNTGQNNNKKSIIDQLAGPDGLQSPLAGKSIPRILTTIGVAIAIPGGLYVLIFLIILPIVARIFLHRSARAAGKNRPQQALKHANRAVKLSRRSPHVHARRGLYRLQSGDLAGALEDAEAALTRDSNLALAYYVRGAVHDEQGDREAACADYAAFLDHHKHDDEQTQHARRRLDELGSTTS